MGNIHLIALGVKNHLLSGIRLGLVVHSHKQADLQVKFTFSKEQTMMLVVREKEEDSQCQIALLHQTARRPRYQNSKICWRHKQRYLIICPIINCYCVRQDAYMIYFHTKHANITNNINYTVINKSLTHIVACTMTQSYY